MKHTWEYLRKSQRFDHPDYWGIEDDAKLNEWAKRRGLFRSRQTGETTHKLIKMEGLSFWSKIYYGMTRLEATG